jgi:hypothetical protein
MKLGSITRVLALLASLAVAGAASARTEGGSGYSKAQTFSCALRLLRVERGYAIVEKDAEAAYVLFEYPLSGQKSTASGALEIVETASGVKVYVQLPRLPSYHESVLRDALLRKLREEYGPPPTKTPPSEKPEPPNDGAKKKPDPSRKAGKPEKPDETPDDEN